MQNSQELQQEDLEALKEELEEGKRMIEESKKLRTETLEALKNLKETNPADKERNKNSRRIGKEKWKKNSVTIKNNLRKPVHLGHFGDFSTQSQAEVS